MKLKSELDNDVKIFGNKKSPVKSYGFIVEKKQVGP